MDRLGLVIHWIGLIATCFMLVFSFLDQSQDELIIHLIASSFPILIGWMFRVLLVGKCNCGCNIISKRNYFVPFKEYFRD
jgi:hypothetical protein